MRILIWLVSLFGFTSLICAIVIYVSISNVVDRLTLGSLQANSPVFEIPYVPEVPRKK